MNIVGCEEEGLSEDDYTLCHTELVRLLLDHFSGHSSGLRYGHGARYRQDMIGGRIQLRSYPTGSPTASRWSNSAYCISQNPRLNLHALRGTYAKQGTENEMASFHPSLGCSNGNSVPLSIGPICNYQ